MKVDHDTYRVTWSAEDGEHVGLCAEFPSLTWLANTPEAALAGIRETVGQVVADMRPTRCRQASSSQASRKERLEQGWMPGRMALPPPNTGITGGWAGRAGGWRIAQV